MARSSMASSSMARSSMARFLMARPPTVEPPLMHRIRSSHVVAARKARASRIRRRSKEKCLKIRRATNLRRGEVKVAAHVSLTFQVERLPASYVCCVQKYVWCLRA